MFKKLLTILLSLFAVAAFAAVDINKATQADLESIKGIGPVISTKILDERKKGGPFKDWDDVIARVKGLGEGNAAKFSGDGLTVNGAAFKVAAAKKDDKTSADKAGPKRTTGEKAEMAQSRSTKTNEAKAASAPAAGSKAAMSASAAKR
jgi:competence protein ComEA